MAYVVSGQDDEGKSLEQVLAEINETFKRTAEGLASFTKTLFDTSVSTGYDFETIVKTAITFAQQGLSVDETVRRTRDALILARLAGIDAKQSIETLAATVRATYLSAVKSAEAVNKLAAADAKFAVSTRDLAEGIARAGAAANDAAVSFDDLILLIAIAQQTTARGGAVIGNSLKTIFERVQRADTLHALRLAGIQTTTTDGKTLSTMALLRAIADAKLTSIQEREFQEILGGIFQLNMLRAILKGLKDGGQTT